MAHRHICLECGAIEDRDGSCSGCEGPLEGRRASKTEYWRVVRSEPWPGMINTMAGEDLELALRGVIKASALRIKDELDPAYERAGDIVKRALIHFLANASPRALVEHGTTDGLAGPLNRNEPLPEPPGEIAPPEEPRPE